MKNRVIIGVAILAFIAGAFFFVRSRRAPIAGEEAYIGERTLTVWSRLSQVRESVATLHYGEPVAVLEHKKEQVQVRTSLGAVGWTEQRYLLDSALWHRAADLRARSRDLPVQARAHSRVATNAHIEPGRPAARIFQFPAGVALEILERAVAEVKPSAEESGAAGAANSSDEQEAKKEDWVLVRGKTEDAGEVSGWVLRRFIDLETPPEIAEYAAGFRFVAWFELNRVADGDKMRPQFLAMGAQGGEGHPCDFTLLRVYTWGPKRRYETAYIESFLCGHFPIRVRPAKAPGGDAGFSFTNQGKRGEESREYEMHLTSVRRVDLDKRRRAAGRPHK